MKVLRILWKSLADFFRDDGLTLAGSMSYFTMMAFVPFCMLLITLFGHLLGRYPEFYRFFLGRLSSLFPEAAGGMTQEVMKLISYNAIGKTGLLLYGFLSYQVLASMENALNAVFKTAKKRHILISLLISIVVVTFIIAIVIVSFATSTVIPLLSEVREYLPNIRIGRFTGFVIRYVLPFLMILGTVTMTYKLLPVAKVKAAYAFRGALFTTVMIEVAKFLFSWYVVAVAQFGKIYGSLTAVVVFLLWIFYSWSIFLIGAEIVHNLDRPAKNAR